MPLSTFLAFLSRDLEIEEGRRKGAKKSQQRKAEELSRGKEIRRPLWLWQKHRKVSRKSQQRTKRSLLIFCKTADLCLVVVVDLVAGESPAVLSVAPREEHVRVPDEIR